VNYRKNNVDAASIVYPATGGIALGEALGWHEAGG